MEPNAVPHDPQAEVAVLGGCLVGGLETVTLARKILPADEPFYAVFHQQVWAVITALADKGKTPDIDGVWKHAMKNGIGKRWVQGRDDIMLAEMIGVGLGGTFIVEPCERLVEAASRRRLAEIAASLGVVGRGGGDTYDAMLRTQEQIARLLGSTGGTTDTPEELDAFLTVNEDESYDWVVPDLWERGDRLIITGAEGSGKSTLVRQIAIMTASGISPFSLTRFNPVRSLLIDLENSKRQSQRKLEDLRRLAGKRYSDEGMFVKCRPEGLDLLIPDNVKRLTAWIEETRPDIILTGPIYKMVGGNPIEEEPARAVTQLFDRLRTQYGFVLIIEAHTPYGDPRGKRPMRPFGASIWSRWPEFGLFVPPDGGAVQHWRPGRDERQWPAALRRGTGNEWPWVAVSTPESILWSAILHNYQDSLIRPSLREIAKKLGESNHRNVQKAIDAHKAEWSIMFPDGKTSTESNE